MIHFENLIASNVFKRIIASAFRFQAVSFRTFRAIHKPGFGANFPNMKKVQITIYADREHPRELFCRSRATDRGKPNICNVCATVSTLEGSPESAAYYCFVGVAVMTIGPCTDAWLNAVKRGQTLATNGPLLSLKVNGKEVGDTLRLPAAKRGKDHSVAAFVCAHRSS